MFIKYAIIVLFIYLFYYYKTRDNKIIKPILTLLFFMAASLSIFFILPFLKWDFNTDFISSLLSVIFFAIYLPLTMLLLVAAIINPFMSGVLAEDIKKRKEGKSILINKSVSSIVFWCFIFLFLFFVG